LINLDEAGRKLMPSDNFNEQGQINNKTPLKSMEGKVQLPDFDTLRRMSKHDPAGLEHLRQTLCQQVIDGAPQRAQRRLSGLMFQIDAKRSLAKDNLQACESISHMMNESLTRMQLLLKDLRTMQSTCMALSETSLPSTPDATTCGAHKTSAKIIPFTRNTEALSQR
jgi:hypothetical protein